MSNVTLPESWSLQLPFRQTCVRAKIFAQWQTPSCSLSRLVFGLMIPSCFLFPFLVKMCRIQTLWIFFPALNVTRVWPFNLYDLMHVTGFRTNPSQRKCNNWDEKVILWINTVMKCKSWKIYICMPKCIEVFIETSYFKWFYIQM